MTSIPRYFLVRNGESYGPFSIADLVRLEGDRRVGPNDQIRTESGDSLQPWSEVRRTLNMPPLVPAPTAPPTVRPDLASEASTSRPRRRALEILVPVNVSLVALVAPYVSLGGVFTFGVLGLVGIGLGVVAIATRRPEQAGLARGVVAIALGLLVVAGWTLYLINR